MNSIQIGVVMGSSSDWETMQHAVAILQQFGIAHEAQVVSAHRMPDDMFAYAEAAAGRGLKAIIAGAGGPTRTAIAHAQEAERLGAHGVLLLPHYLTEAGQEGLIAHVEQVCKSVKFGVIVYNRDRTRFTPESLAILAERCPNLVGFKDGMGNIETMSSIFMTMGDRFAYLGGLPTAEVYAAAYKALGTPVYSSAVFNFIPRTAMAFYEAVRTDDMATQHKLLKEFFMPYLKIRNRVEGYGVSIIKAGAKLVGHDAGPVRAPLTDLKPSELEELKALIDKLGPQ